MHERVFSYVADVAYSRSIRSAPRKFCPEALHNEHMGGGNPIPRVERAGLRCARLRKSQPSSMYAPTGIRAVTATRGNQCRLHKCPQPTRPTPNPNPRCAANPPAPRCVHITATCKAHLAESQIRSAKKLWKFQNRRHA